jgi:hypothetical protein
MRKHGEENILITVLESASTFEGLCAAEISWIAKLNTRGATGLNLTAGGEGQLGRIPTAEQRATLSRSHMGQERTTETRRKISAANLGEKNDLAKLTEKQVENIKIMLWHGLYGKDIALAHGVTAAAIASINVGATWAHVDHPYIGPGQKPGSFYRNKRERAWFRSEAERLATA